MTYFYKTKYLIKNTGCFIPTQIWIGSNHHQKIEIYYNKTFNRQSHFCCKCDNTNTWWLTYWTVIISSYGVVDYLNVFFNFFVMMSHFTQSKVHTILFSLQYFYFSMINSNHLFFNDFKNITLNVSSAMMKHLVSVTKNFMAILHPLDAYHSEFVGWILEHLVFICIKHWLTYLYINLMKFKSFY